MPGIAIVADTHTHTVASPHAYGTIRENLDAARRLGHRALAMTDHGPAIPDSPHLWHFSNMRILPREVDGVVLLRGIEANLMDRQGTLDVADDLLRQLDWVIASLHPPVFPPSTPTDHTEAWLGVLANPWVDVLGHPGDPSYPCDYEAVVRACGRAGTCIEINNGSFRVRPGSEPNCRTLAALCARYGVPVVVSSDAHCPWDVGVVDQALALLGSVGFPPELVLNADADRLLAFIRAKRGGPR